MGDGALVEFPSVVDAVEYAVAVQRGMAERRGAAIEKAFGASVPTVIEVRENADWLI